MNIHGISDAEVEAPNFWPPDGKSWLIGKDPDVGKDWKGEGKGMTVDEITEWHHWFKQHEPGQTPGDGEGQEAWHVTVLEVAKNHTWLGDWTLPPPPSCTPTTSCSSHVHLSAQGEQRKQKSCEVRLQRRWYQDLLSQRKQGSSHFVAFPSLPPMTSCQEPEKPHWSVHVVPSWWSQT